MTLQELTQAVHDLKMAKYPHAAKIPHYFPTIPFVANSANSLTRCIEAYIRVTGGYADRINNTGIYDPKRIKVGGAIPAWVAKRIFGCFPLLIGGGFAPTS